jgi:hypothetical protein
MMKALSLFEPVINRASPREKKATTLLGLMTLKGCTGDEKRHRLCIESSAKFVKQVIVAVIRTLPTPDEASKRGLYLRPASVV